mmetsp:Transcript_22887/g.32260  ORF Transcript_22887/g.32260 Transcript_22887/m.32260 type:complete len:664 (-) Transcript_22887:104-2095(-)
MFCYVMTSIPMMMIIIHGCCCCIRRCDSFAPSVTSTSTSMPNRRLYGNDNDEKNQNHDKNNHNKNNNKNNNNNHRHHITCLFNSLSTNNDDHDNNGTSTDIHQSLSSPSSLTEEKDAFLTTNFSNSSYTQQLVDDMSTITGTERNQLNIKNEEKGYEVEKGVTENYNEKEKQKGVAEEYKENEKEVTEEHESVKILTQVETNEDETQQDQSVSTPTSSTSTSTTTTTIGIGGQGGIIYDVNKLKRNLVQEAVREYKKELLVLLAAPPPTHTLHSTQQDTTNTATMQQSINTQRNNMAIEDKIRSLVESNPVSTTTDSNLLEGSWYLAYATEHASAILHKSQIVPHPRSRTTPKSTLSKSSVEREINPNQDYHDANNANNHHNRVADNLFRAFKRDIYLENLKDEEDPYVVDSNIYFNGLWSTQQLWLVAGLTRRNLLLKPLHKTYRAIGKRIVQKKFSIRKDNALPPIELEIVYLDSDLCIARGHDIETLQVYTKNDFWIGSKEQMRRKMTLVKLTVSRFIGLPLRLAKSTLSPFVSRRRTNTTSSRSNGKHLKHPRTLIPRIINEENDNNSILFKKKSYNDNNDESILTVLRLGDVDENIDDVAWEGEEDPFVHLSADERQKIMRKMSIKEIEEAGMGQKRRANKRRKRHNQEQKAFKRPKN